MASTTPTRGSGFWIVLILVVIVILGGIWWFATGDTASDGVDIDLDPSVAEPIDPDPTPGITDPTTTAPQPLPGSPAATGTAGAPSGTTGETTHPGDPTEPGMVESAPAADTN